MHKLSYRGEAGLSRSKPRNTENIQREEKEEKTRTTIAYRPKPFIQNSSDPGIFFSCQLPIIISPRKPSKLIDVCNKNVNKHTSQQGTLHADAESPTQVSGVRINLTDVPGLNLMNFK